MKSIIWGEVYMYSMWRGRKEPLSALFQESGVHNLKFNGGPKAKDLMAACPRWLVGHLAVQLPCPCLDWCGFSLSPATVRNQQLSHWGTRWNWLGSKEQEARISCCRHPPSRNWDQWLSTLATYQSSRAFDKRWHADGNRTNQGKVKLSGYGLCSSWLCKGA